MSNASQVKDIISFKTAKCIIATLPFTIYTFTETMATTTKLL